MYALLFLLIPIYIGIAFWLKIFPFKKVEKNKYISQEGLKIVSDSKLSDYELIILDQYYLWAKLQGLSVPDTGVQLEIIWCGKTPAGNTGYPQPNSPTKFAAGEVLSLNPIIIKLCQQNLENLKHELMHVILFQKTGKPDENHEGELWKRLNLF